MLVPAPEQRKTVAGHVPRSDGHADNLASSVFRPIQYLGNKLRSLPAIIKAARELDSSEGAVVDLFSGTSVVSQSFAAEHNKVIAVDTQQSCQIIASAMLGVGREEELLTPVQANAVVTDARRLNLHVSWEHLIECEDKALLARSGAGLRAINRSIPVLTSPRKGFVPLAELLAAPDKSAVDIAPLFALTLAGSYFGIRQSVTIDALRWAIEHGHQKKQLTNWQYASLMTALMFAMSKAVYSAGKHFAQPLTAGRGMDKNFRMDRMIQDRSIDVAQEFLEGVKLVNSHARPGKEFHQVLGSPAEVVWENLKSPVSLVYADPPYTAQQYSRFYHALETLVSYRIPLAAPGEKQTAGLYPLNRFKSAFCSKRKAPAAFESIIMSTYSRGASLLLSYSSSAQGSTGNDRMISLEGILEICGRYFGKRRIKLLRLDHTYRQFNSEGRTNRRRNDPELLIACRR